MFQMIVFKKQIMLRQRVKSLRKTMDRKRKAAIQAMKATTLSMKATTLATKATALLISKQKSKRIMHQKERSIQVKKGYILGTPVGPRSPHLYGTLV
jgi:hypothetical protein